MSTPIVRYRKLPVEVDTIEWTGHNLDELTAFTGGLFIPVDPGEGLTGEYSGKVFDALHSTWVLVKTGQRVVRGVLGEFYPIAEDVLAETYELATNPAAADLLPKADVVAWLVKKAREFRAAGGDLRAAQADAVAGLASKVERGAIRPDNLRMLPPDFFEPGHTYTREHHASTIRFLVRYIDDSPEGIPYRVAFGWRTEDGDVCASPFDSDDFTGWTDTTTGDNQ